MPLWKIHSYIYPLRKFRNNQEGLWYHDMLYLVILESSRDFSMIPVNSRNFYWHGKEKSSEFWAFLQGFRTFYDNVFLGSRWLVIILENSFNQINALLTSIYLPSISPISGSTETKLTKYETDKHHTCYTIQWHLSKYRARMKNLHIRLKIDLLSLNIHQDIQRKPIGWKITNDERGHLNKV